MIHKKSIFIILFTFSCASPSKQNSSILPCREDPARQEKRSKELAQIVQADQDDRQDWEHKTPDQMTEVMLRDSLRRQRVGEIFGEGCFLKAQDFSAAALVFQHGNVPEHFYQTFVWAKRAVELGDSQQKRMMALGIDRYLVNMGQKQLFASQAHREDVGSNGCWCLQSVERSFPDTRRKETTGRNLSEAFQWVQEMNHDKNCPKQECPTRLKPTAKKSIPGFW